MHGLAHIRRIMRRSGVANNGGKLKYGLGMASAINAFDIEPALFSETRSELQKNWRGARVILDNMLDGIGANIGFVIFDKLGMTNLKLF